MRPRHDPFLHRVTREPWGLDGPVDVLVRKVSDIAECFASEAASDGEVYRVVSPKEGEPSDMTYALTVMKPGKVGDEYHMTKGHFHKRHDAGEIYHCLAGEGLLLLQDRLGTVSSVEMGEGALVYVPPAVAHRVVNTGMGELVFLAVYSPDAGHDYDSIVRRGFAKRVLERGGAWELVDSQ
jgi:glucose-6-phosphate isomerase